MEKLDLKIESRAQEVMEKDALNAFPNECCGFFFGIENGVRNITQAIPVQNSKKGDKRRRFFIDPTDYMWAERYAAENGAQLLGIYHSHPKHPADPSEHDRSQAMPWFSYIILSVNNDEIQAVKSFQLNEERQFEEENIL